MAIFKELFNDLTTNAWQFDTGVTLTAGEVANTGTVEAYMWNAIPDVIPVNSVFRMDFVMKVLSLTGQSYLGLAGGTPGTKPLDSQNRFAIGISNGSFTTYIPSGLGGSGFQVPSPTITPVVGEYYNCQIISDGKTISFSLAKLDNSQKTIVARAPVTNDMTNFYFRFNNPNVISLSKLAVMTGSLDGYNDPSFDVRMRLISYPNNNGSQYAERVYIEIPKTYRKGILNRYVITGHGSGGTALSHMGQQFFDDLIERDYIMATPEARGDHWGHWTVETDARLARDYIIKNFTAPYKGFLIGESMGGYLATLTALAYPDMFGAIALFYPSLNLDWRYYGNIDGNNRETEINTAYGCTNKTYHRMTRGRNVQDRVSEFTRFPIMATHGDADTTVNYRHSLDFVEELQALGGTATHTLVPGVGHGAVECKDGIVVADFFDAVTDLSRPTKIKHDFQGGIRLN